MPETQKLCIIRQDSILQEHYVDEETNVETLVHTVVKAHPFLLHIESTDSLTKYKLHATLLYDEDGTKEVPFVKVEPMEYKVHLDNFGTRGTVEVKIKVLTSQHEDMFFKVALEATDPLSKHHLETVSEPIKCVSKILGTKNTKAPLKKKPRRSVTAASNVTSSKKRTSPTPTLDPNIVSKLKELEEQQKEQRLLIERLSKNDEPKQDGDFDTIFWKLLENYNSVSPVDRHSKIRRILTAPGIAQTFVKDFMTAWMAESIGLDIQQPANSQDFLPVTRKETEFDLICSNLLNFDTNLQAVLQ